LQALSSTTSTTYDSHKRNSRIIMKTQSILLPLTICVLAVALSSCSFLSSVAGKDEFIRVRGTQLILHGQPYHFAGTNMWYGAYLGSPGPTGDRARLVRELDALKAFGFTNIRICAATEESAIRRSVKPAFQRAPGVVDDSLLQGLDFLLAEMGKRHMRAVLYLGNYWEWSGGFSQYNVWTGQETVDPEDTTKGWHAFMDFSTTFYTNQKALEFFRNYVRLVVTRTNSVNGLAYTADPTIMAWQLVNEPRPGRDGDPGKNNLPVFYQWVEETAELIHQLDTNHLVSAGSEGIVGTLQSEEYYKRAYATPGIDYLNLHLWPLNWGWFKPQQWEETLPQTELNALAYITRHFPLARALGKPIVMDEFGLGRDGGEILPGTPTRARDRYYARICTFLADSARAGAPIGGSNFWAWGGEGAARHPDGMWQLGDAFVGDPPQEPQGRNSVFVSDTSTLRILSGHARAMTELDLKSIDNGR
jgi:mannan endo-1,4-beta-mannosidase